jgi:hypothetical protein
MMLPLTETIVMNKYIFYTESNGGIFKDIAFIESKIWTKTSIERARSTRNDTCWEQKSLVCTFRQDRLLVVFIIAFEITLQI